jgi:hypothetical protein
LCTRNVPQPRHLLPLHPLLGLFQQRLAPDRRDSAGAMAFRAKLSATRESTRHPVAALANWAFIIGGFNANWHAPKYRTNLTRRESGCGEHFGDLVSIAAPAGLGLNRWRSTARPTFIEPCVPIRGHVPPCSSRRSQSSGQLDNAARITCNAPSLAPFRPGRLD